MSEHKDECNTESKSVQFIHVSTPILVPEQEDVCDVKTNVYVLTIVNDIDDYKRRGDTPSADVYLFTSKKKCQNMLKKIIMDLIKERIDELDDDEVLETVPKVTLKHFIKEAIKDKEYSNWNFNSNLEIPMDEIEDMYEWIAKGEYVQYKWMYQIEYKTVE